MPDRIAMREKDFGIWQEVSWADYWDDCPSWSATPCWRWASSPATGSRSTRRTAASGCTPTSAQSRSRATTVGLYPTNPPPEVAYLLSHSGARVLIAEDQEQVDKALEVLDRVPDLETDRLPRTARHPVPLRPTRS